METQSRTTGQRQLGGHQLRATLPGPTLFSGNHPDRTHQQVSQQPTSKPLWHRKNMQTCRTEIPLANALP